MLRVWRASGKELAAIPVEQLTTVQLLKQDLQGLCGVPRFRQRLVREDGTKLEDNDMLSSPANLQLVLLSLTSTSEEQADELSQAAAVGDVSHLEKMLSEPRDPNCLAPHYLGGVTTPLTAASEAGQIETVKLLLEAGADQELREMESDEAHMMAARIAQIRNEELKRQMVKGFSDFARGATSLWMASEAGHAEVACLLLQAKADKNCSNTFGQTPLWISASKGHKEVVRILLEAGADWKKGDNVLGDTPLQQATANGHTEVARMLRAAS